MYFECVTLSLNLLSIVLFQPLLMVLVSSNKNSAQLLARLQEFSTYPDVLYNVWKQLFPIAVGLQRNGQRPDENFIRNYLDLVDKFPLPKPGRGERGEDHDLTENLLCGRQGMTFF